MCLCFLEVGGDGGNRGQRRRIGSTADRTDILLHTAAQNVTMSCYLSISEPAAVVAFTVNEAGRKSRPLFKTATL